MLKERVITACVLFSSLLLVLFSFTPQLFQYFIIGAFAIAAWEWANLSSLSHQVLRVVYALIVASVIYYLVDYTGLNHKFYLSFNSDKIKDIFGLGCLWWAISLLWVKTYPGSSVIWGSSAARSFIGVLVLVPAALALMYIRGLNNGQWYFLYIVGVVITADVGAYFAGRAFGKHKLAPSVSPGKTLEGFVGGLVACALYAFAISYFYEIYSLSSSQLIIITMVAALASVLGDLVESMIKRHRGIKDSSNLLPGHGGVLDRIDSICAAAPVFVLLGMLV